MSGLFIILIFSVFCLFSSYQCLKHKRAFWLAPTIVGFTKRRQADHDNHKVNSIIGVVTLICGLIGLFFVLFSIFKYLF